MTIEELRLRVMAAFPGAMVKEDMGVVWAEVLGDPAELGDARVPFFHAYEWDGGLVIRAKTVSGSIRGELWRRRRSSAASSPSPPTR